MKITLFVATTLLILAAGSAGARQQMLRFEGMKIPLKCSQWKKNPDGTWVQSKVFMVDENRFEGNSFKHSPQARQLDKVCG